MSLISRRSFVATGAALAALRTIPVQAGTATVRIGYQKYGNLLLLKTSGTLEKRLQTLGWAVEWRLFVSGPPLMEALAAGAIDFGSAGETPPIFAQAAGAPLVYLGSEPPAPAGEAFLVRNDSPITSVRDLRGKKIALNKGSNVHYLFVKALAKAGLSLNDVTLVYLSPSDGRAAFERGSVDAWVIWDPFLAAAQSTGRARILVDGTGLVANRQFYIGSRRFTDKAVFAAIHDSIAAVDHETSANPASAATTLSPEIGLPDDVVVTALKRQTWNIQPMDARIVDEQQSIADIFFRLGLIPKQVHISDALPLD